MTLAPLRSSVIAFFNSASVAPSSFRTFPPSAVALKDAQDHQFDGNVLIAKLLEQVSGPGEGAVGLGGEVLLICSLHARKAANRFIQLGLDGGDLDIHFLQKKLRHILFGFQNPFQQMGSIYLLLFKAGGNLLRFQDGFLGFYGKVVVGHDLLLVMIFSV